MVIKTLAHKFLKIAYYIIVSLIVARTLGNPEIWMNDDLTNQLGHLLHGPGEIGADNFYDMYFYISLITVFPITTLIYYLTMKLIKKLRSK
ncbi:hypothetical protein F3I27_15875 [Pantoea sp. Bo_2]|uniref:Uncharacterized protein n=1 Tax=Candidatus Pantoea gossypiicola TaxID=2608008 RepID=A0AB34CPH4_9GAMM|nr:hypothetical protein F3I59_00065 [Pantoea sp. VH_8]KAA5938486.1 hypothetical protein F3I58_01540 [Pantoea sp. VH_4]KAA5943881.1 hypothetical protein F3I57_13415 [Pantoea sp. VH_3]KAA5951367.1 hypothetical protein F3I56_13925 [Pantoea sp. VH_25]KAA5952456.1 hypothetical protein F3I55_17295 [Pantoea sp. VH_24]KAA5959852.1 hypothetical protein F3I53_11910 [Pantoea sp. VH_16]KAA5961984.1 hypothetical protein F3I54_18135 [Pantoea sp. VH_18]KAA5981299.1 hypothetical protein F3I48_14445 [Pantoea